MQAFPNYVIHFFLWCPEFEPHTCIYYTLSLSTELTSREHYVILLTTNLVRGKNKNKKSY